MFTISFVTDVYQPDLHVTIRNDVDGWAYDISGRFEQDRWVFHLDESVYPRGMEFKFVLEQTYWMRGENLYVEPQSGDIYVFDRKKVRFPP